jgi:glycosyltransferase involved in cell wall biosynthesis
LALPHAEYRGWQTSEAVKAAMREARALVFPSLWYEGMPMVVVEALASGLPVICSDVTSASEIVADGVSGLIVRAGDSASLEEALVRCDDLAFVESLSRAAYERYWADPFSQARFGEGILKIYEKILASEMI